MKPLKRGFWATHFTTRSEAGSIAVDDETRQGRMCRCFGVQISSCQDKIPICVTTIGDPHLLSVEDIVITFFLSLRLYVGHVRSSSRLSYAIGLLMNKDESRSNVLLHVKWCTYTHEGFFNHTAEILFLLLFITSQNDRRFLINMILIKLTIWI